MGNDRAVKEGRWINRPKTGYDLIDGALVPNADAYRVQEIFRMRAKNASYRTIEEHTGITYSTVNSILESRIYLGEILHNGDWFPGKHEPIITDEEWCAAHLGLAKSVQPSKDLLTGRVRCGLCERRMAIGQNGKGSLTYKCRHRGMGCPQPARSTKGLARAAVLGMSLLGRDDRLQEAIRRKLAGRPRVVSAKTHRGRRPSAAVALGTLSDERSKLLRLYYAGGITVEGFKEEEQRLLTSIEMARAQAADEQFKELAKNDLELRFEQVATILRELDIESVWEAADEDERRVLVQELIEWVTVFPDHLEVKVSGAPPTQCAAW